MIFTPHSFSLVSRFRFPLLLALAIVLGSCAVNIRTIYDHEADFGNYKTFCWMEGCEFKISGPTDVKDGVLRENLKKSIITELKNKGLTLDTQNPDLLIGFTITMKDEQAIVYHQSEDMPFYRPLENDRNVIEYLKGTLVLGMADKKESKMVWQSFAVSYLDLNPDFTEKEVLKGIKLVLKRFPPEK